MLKGGILASRYGTIKAKDVALSSNNTILLSRFLHWPHHPATGAVQQDTASAVMLSWAYWYAFQTWKDSGAIASHFGYWKGNRCKSR